MRRISPRERARAKAYTDLKEEYVTFRNAAERCTPKGKPLADEIVDEISKLLEGIEYNQKELHIFFPVTEMSDEEVAEHLREFEQKPYLVWKKESGLGE